MMNTKNLRNSALVCLVFTVLWMVLMILSISNTGPVRTLEQAINSAANAGILFRITYINAVFVTVTAAVFFICLYCRCKPLNDHWSFAGLIFVPVYCVLNLLVYFSQIAVVPRLVALMESSGYPEVYQAMLGQFVQSWSGSAISAVNQLAYAVLGIPSIIFGMLLVRDRKVSVPGGWLLILNGLSCITGVIGTAVGSETLAMGSVAGGALFLFALVAIVLGK